QLQETNHEVVACLVGKARPAECSSNLAVGMDCPIHYFSSPNLMYNTRGKGLNLGQTFKKNLTDLPIFLKSMDAMHHHIEAYKPDLIINFYDFLCGLYQLRYAFSAPPMVCIGH